VPNVALFALNVAIDCNSVDSELDASEEIEELGQLTLGSIEAKGDASGVCGAEPDGPLITGSNMFEYWLLDTSTSDGPSFGAINCSVDEISIEGIYQYIKLSYFIIKF
jgi:hypothetical protein